MIEKSASIQDQSEETIHHPHLLERIGHKVLVAAANAVDRAFVAAGYPDAPHAEQHPKTR